MSKEFKGIEHSDILMHWTGYDIDKNDKEMQSCLKLDHRRFALRPIDRPSLIDDPKIIDKYLERLKNTLKFGMWMVNDKPLTGDPIELSSSRSTHDGRGKNSCPVARTSFTELKLSEARRHAYEYGRLGFGVKRTFLFRRAGLPMIYFNKQVGFTGHKNWISELISRNDFGASFLKHMSEKEDLNYKYYSESEWRIICPNDFSGKNEMLNSIRDLIVDINGNLSEEVKKYGNGISETDLKTFIAKIKKIEKNKKGLKYLLPFDHELSVIVYPCPEVKILSEADKEIRDLIKKTRCHHDLKGKVIHKYYDKVTKYSDFSTLDSIEKKRLLGKLKKDLDGIGERMMLPMEIDLDTISHF